LFARLAKICRRIDRALEKRMFVVVLSGVILGLSAPLLAAGRSSVTYLFAYMTLVTALNISWRGIYAAVATPWPILQIMGLLHAVMPLVVLVLAGLTLGRDSLYTVGLVLAAVLPNAVTSVIWTGIAGGEVPLVLASVTIESLLSPVLVPFSVWLFLGQSVSMDTAGLIKGLTWMIVLPTIIGLTLHDLSRGRIGPKLAPINGPLSKLGLVFVVAVNLAVARGIILGESRTVLPLICLLLIQTALALLLGLGTARALGHDHDRVAAFTFSVGMRNISAGMVIALQYFEPRTALPVVLGFLVQQPLAALFVQILEKQASASFGNRRGRAASDGE